MTKRQLDILGTTFATLLAMLVVLVGPADEPWTPRNLGAAGLVLCAWICGGKAARAVYASDEEYGRHDR